MGLDEFCNLIIRQSIGTSTGQSGLTHFHADTIFSWLERSCASKLSAPWLARTTRLAMPSMAPGIWPNLLVV